MDKRIQTETETNAYELLARDLYEQLMIAYQALIFDGPFGPTQNRECAAVAVRARKILGIGESNGNTLRRS